MVAQVVVTSVTVVALGVRVAPPDIMKPLLEIQSGLVVVVVVVVVIPVMVVWAATAH